MTKQGYLEYNKACEAEIREKMAILLKIKGKLPDDPTSRDRLFLASTVTRYGSDLDYIVRTHASVSFLSEAEYAPYDKKMVGRLQELMDRIRTAHEYAVRRYAVYMPQ